MKSAASRRTVLALLVAAVLAVASWPGLEPRWLERTELATADVRARLFAAPTQRQDIRVILAGEAARKRSGYWPPPRGQYRLLVDLCKAGGARALVFATSFVDPYELAGEDERFAETLSGAGTLPIILPVEIYSEPDGDGEWPPSMAESPFRVDGVERWLREHPGPNPFAHESAVFSLPSLVAEARAVGHPGLRRDGEIVRTTRPFVTFDGQHVPFLGLVAQAAAEAARSAIGGRMPSLALEGNVFRVDYEAGTEASIRRRALPLDVQGRLLLNFRKPPDAVSAHLYPADTFKSVLDWWPDWNDRRGAEGTAGEGSRGLDPRDFRDAYVFYGLDEQRVETPVGELTLTELQALMLDNLLSDDFLTPAPGWSRVPATFVLVLAAFLAAHRIHSRGLRAAFLAGCAAAPMLAGGFAYRLGWMTPVATPALGVLVVAALTLLPGMLPLMKPRRRSRASAPRPPHERSGFDVFLSHNSTDKEQVRELCDALEARGVRAWLDEREIRPGERWQDVLEEIIVSARAAAVLVGRDGFGPWHDAEMQACLSELMSRGRPVIPVLLPGAPGDVELPLFLRQLAWVDLRHRGSFSGEGLDRLVWGITGERLDSR